MADTGSKLQVGFIAAAAALLLGGFLLFWSAPDPETVAAAGETAALRMVDSHRVQAVPVHSRAELAGVLEPRRSVRLYSETRGPVIFIGAETFDRVEEAQELLRVDPLQAEVAVERAVANLARRESELALARSNLERREGLSQRGVASDADLEDAQNARKVAEAALREARAELKQARDDLANKTIRAPFAGALRSFSVEEGEFVQEGQELGELLDLSAARALLGLSDRQVVAVAPGEAVQARLEAYPDEAFEGTIVRVAAASDPVTKKFPVEVELPNPDGRLLPGMVVSVRLDIGSAEPRTVIPAEASVEEFGLHYVWMLVEEEGGLVAHRRRVTMRPLPFRPEEFEVLAGLERGAEIAISDTRQLREGERVQRSARSAP